MAPPRANPYPSAPPVQGPSELYRKVVDNFLGGPLPSKDRIAMGFAAMLGGWGFASPIDGEQTYTAFERGTSKGRIQGQPRTVSQVWADVAAYVKGDGNAVSRGTDWISETLGIESPFIQSKPNREEVAGKVWALLDDPSWFPGATTVPVNSNVAQGVTLGTTSQPRTPRVQIIEEEGPPTLSPVMVPGQIGYPTGPTPEPSPQPTPTRGAMAARWVALGVVVVVGGALALARAMRGGR